MSDKDKEEVIPEEVPVYRLQVMLMKGILSNTTGFRQTDQDREFDLDLAEYINPDRLDELADKIAGDVRTAFKKALEQTG